MTMKELYKVVDQHANVDYDDINGSKACLAAADKIAAMIYKNKEQTEKLLDIVKNELACPGFTIELFQEQRTRIRASIKKAIAESKKVAKERRDTFNKNNGLLGLAGTTLADLKKELGMK